MGPRKPSGSGEFPDGCPYLGGKDWAFRVRDKVYVEHRKQGAQRKSYAVAVVRRLQGQMPAVVAGLTGPATTAMSEAITSELVAQPFADFGSDQSTVWWAALEVDISINEQLSGDDRTPKRRRILGVGTYEAR